MYSLLDPLESISPGDILCQIPYLGRPAGPPPRRSLGGNRRPLGRCFRWPLAERPPTLVQSDSLADVSEEKHWL